MGKDSEAISANIPESIPVTQPACPLTPKADDGLADCHCCVSLSTAHTSRGMIGA